MKHYAIPNYGGRSLVSGLWAFILLIAILHDLHVIAELARVEATHGLIVDPELQERLWISSAGALIILQTLMIVLTRFIGNWTAIIFNVTAVAISSTYLGLLAQHSVADSLFAFAELLVLLAILWSTLIKNAIDQMICMLAPPVR